MICRSLLAGDIVCEALFCRSLISLTSKDRLQAGSYNGVNVFAPPYFAYSIRNSKQFLVSQNQHGVAIAEKAIFVRDGLGVNFL
jgi:hypothetical protein